MSNTQKPKANESDWKKVASCLYRYKGQTYYALLKIRGKQVKQSLETSDREMANRKLRELRGKLEKTERCRRTSFFTRRSSSLLRTSCARDKRWSFPFERRICEPAQNK